MTTEDPLRDQIIEEYKHLDEGASSPTVAVRYNHLKALLLALDETDQLDTLVNEAAGTLDRDPDEYEPSQTAVLKLLVRIGLEEASPETLETLREAWKEHLLQEAGEI